MEAFGEIKGLLDTCVGATCIQYTQELEITRSRGLA